MGGISRTVKEKGTEQFWPKKGIMNCSKEKYLIRNIIINAQDAQEHQYV
jgi:hypothetical protein